MKTGRLVVGVTGASGALYAVRFLKRAVEHFREVYTIYTDQAIQVLQTELDLQVTRETLSSETLLGEPNERLILLDLKNFFTPPASGSFRHDGMVIIPCSMGTLGRIANGASDDLITRAADVCLKEKRPLIVVPRETPYNLVQLRNMVQLAEAGAIILPANPSFYGKPKTIEDLVDTILARVLQLLGVEQALVPEWMQEEVP